MNFDPLVDGAIAHKTVPFDRAHVRFNFGIGKVFGFDIRPEVVTIADEVIE
jgi:hypothetical protein